MTRFSLFRTLSLTPLLVLAGCQTAADEQSDTGLVLDGGDDSTTGADGDGDPTGGGCSEALDILIVLDNSRSMGSVQRRLVLGIGGLLDPLDAAGVDWRIGVTTSDNGNPWCAPGTTTPEGGKLVLSPCTTRLGDFLAGNDIDVQATACTDLCSLQEVPIVPTTTEVDDSAAPRPWIERIDGQTNLGNAVSVEEALGCVLPQGVSGCGFESQLEASYLALNRMQTSTENSYGFLRTNADLLVLVISDEADCSYNKEWATIFDVDGNKVFWSDPTAAFPSSAVCWNAGVECTGDPSNYDCVAQNYDFNGSPTSDPSQAVLQPISRYVDKLEEIRLAKLQLDLDATVLFSVIGGVGLDGSVTYADSPDPNFQTAFGIGPGCEDASVQAVPPVRMREVALDAGGAVGPICASNYEPLLSQLVAPFVASCG